MIRGLIFDFDGLIIDTEWSDYASWQAVFGEFGLEFPLDLWLKEVGTVGAFDPLDYLEETLARPVDRATLRQQRYQRDREMVRMLEPLPGVVDIITQAKQRGLRLAVASSSEHEWVDTHLKRLGLYDYFDVVCCRDDVGGRSKPDPAVYQLALQKLNLTAENVIVFEDSPNGIKAAKTAGIFTFAVPNEVTRHGDVSAADVQLHSLAGLPLSDMLRLPAGSNATKVNEFHRRLDAYIANKPTLPPDDVIAVRKTLIDEEYQESQAALTALGGNIADEEEEIAAIAEVVQELADLLYVTYGAMWACGVEPDAVFAEVHRANMQKAGGPRRADGKILKPANWQSPDIVGLVRAMRDRVKP